MKKHLLMITTAASILVCGSVAAIAQDDDTDTPNMQQLEQAQQDAVDEGEDNGPGRRGMMRQCMRQCMSGDDVTGQHATRPMRQRGMMGPFAMRIIFALMDRDGDGTVALEEFQAAHESIFKAMDADKDGTVSMDEMRDFFQGAGKAGLPQRSTPRD
jgi:hypothetical protein